MIFKLLKLKIVIKTSNKLYQLYNLYQDKTFIIYLIT